MNRYFSLVLILSILNFTLMATPKSGVSTIDISFASEPSGITYNRDNGLLYIVGDEGFIYESTLDGLLLRSSYIEPLDLEGIVYNSDTKTLFCLDEKKVALIEVSISDFKVINRISLKKTLKGKKRQFESLTYKPATESQGGIFYIASSIKSSKSGVISSFTLDSNQVISYSETKVPLWDISGLSYNNEKLHMVSDDMDIYGLLNLETREFITTPIHGENQEGIVIVNGNKIILDEVGKLYHK